MTYVRVDCLQVGLQDLQLPLCSLVVLETAVLVSRPEFCDLGLALST